MEELDDLGTSLNALFDELWPNFDPEDLDQLELALFVAKLLMVPRLLQEMGLKRVGFQAAVGWGSGPGM